MRMWEILSERASGPLSRSQVSQLIRKQINRWGEDAWSINNGDCQMFAVALARQLGDGARVITSRGDAKQQGLFPGHSWVEYKGFHYDAESPYGEREPSAMQYHRRLRAIADSAEGEDEAEAVRRSLGRDPVYVAPRKRSE